MDNSSFNKSGGIVMKSIILFAVLILLGQTLFATTHIVSLDGTGDFTVIQDGIDAASNGDTVLVYPGTYYENINYNGKNITIASLYLTKQIDSFVKNTIIDGNQNGSVVKLVNGENNTTLLCGITIQNGTGTLDRWEIISGGGIFLYNSSLNLESCIIQNNVATRGGGFRIEIRNGNNVVNFKKTTVRYNHAYEDGGGISVTSESPVNFNQQERCNIYLNTAGSGNEFAHHDFDQDPVHIFVDTLTVLNPDEFFISSFADDTINIQHGKITPINQDLYISPYGDNTNSGLTDDQPLKNIYFALTKIASDSSHSNTIYIEEGTYSPSLTGEKYPLNLRSYITLQGSDKELTILDAEELSCLLYDWDYQKNYKIEKLSVINGNNLLGGAIVFVQPRGVVIEEVKFEFNKSPHGYGCSVINFPTISTFLKNSTSVLIKDVEIINNKGGGAVNTGPSENTRIENSFIKGNLPNYQSDDLQGCGLSLGGHPYYENRWFSEIINTEITENVNATTEWPNAPSALYVLNRQNVVFVNCTIGNNDATSSGEGVGIKYGSNAAFYNCILYGDYPREMYVNGQSSPNTVTFSHTLIEGGQWDIVVQGTNTLNWLDGNLDTNPMWEGIGEYPYYLSTGSPCIDAGTLDLPDSIEIPLYDLAGNPRIYGDMIDMGAYEWQGYGIDDEPELPEGIITFMNSPNPFKDYTNITCSIRDVLEFSKIKISIYNSKGQLIRTFSDNNFDFSPYTEIYWDGTDEQGKQVAPGAYFYKLEYNGKAVVRKMVMLR